MNDKYFQDTISTLYDLVENAKTASFNKENVVINKNEILNLLDELSERLPGELKQARVMLENQEDIINAAKRKAEQTYKEANEQRNRLIAEHEIYREAKARANEMDRLARERVEKGKQEAIQFLDESLKITEETIAKALSDVRNTRNQFRSNKGNNAPKPQSPIIEDI